MALDFPSIDPVAFSLGPLVVRWYALAYLAGFVLGWKYILHLINKHGEKLRPNHKDVDDFIPWVILGVILGGRMGYVLFYNLDYYLMDPSKILQIWHGGMAFHGGTIGVILAMILFSRIKDVPFLRLSDLVCAAAPIGLFFGRIANFINGELYGRPAELPWAFKFPAGGFIARHPSQLYEAALEGAVLFFVLWALYRLYHNRSGVVSGAFLIGYGMFRMVVELFREPDVQLGFIWNQVSMGQLLSAPMIALGIALIMLSLRTHTEASSRHG